MKIGICENTFIPLRAGMSHKSEIINQILFGEYVEILIHRSDWTKVRLINDNYEGWVDTNVITFLDDVEDFNSDYVLDMNFCRQKDFSLTVNSKYQINIPAGAVLPTESKTKDEFIILSNKYSNFNNLKIEDNRSARDIISDTAIEYMNTPYLWGGRTAWGIDCSGFTQLLFRLAGKLIPRDASQQIAGGTTLNFLSEAQSGDLAFFDNEEGNITHVGIILDSSRIIHASGKVRIDTIDHSGIYNKALKRYTHNLRVIKSFL
ncbi:MAG: hypothetical protein C0596_14800 [Marinilabiliales bacterium]|nr:MAG: hypothetical protein C0596_14800 [Marinilabiliales bacterium]